MEKSVSSVYGIVFVSRLRFVINIVIFNFSEIPVCLCHISSQVFGIFKIVSVSVDKGLKTILICFSHPNCVKSACVLYRTVLVYFLFLKLNVM